MEEIHYHPGARNVVIAESTICKLDGEKGILGFRGYYIQDLARYFTYEEVCFLLLYGKLPGTKEKQDFSRKLVNGRGLPRETVDYIERRAYRLSPVDLLIGVINDLKIIDQHLLDTSEERELERGIKLIACLPTALATYDRFRRGLQPIVSFLPSMGHVENFLYMLRGVKPKRDEMKALDQEFIIHSEHECNNSTFVARAVASTGSDILSALTAAPCSLKGPLHGGANLEVIEFVKMLIQNNVEDIESFVKEEIAKNRKIPGLGHAVYQVIDPRAAFFEKKVLRLLKKSGGEERRIFEALQRIRKVVAEEKNRHPNVDFYSVVLNRILGFPDDFGPALFAAARIPGQVAHVLEQRREGKLIRPRLEYVGPDLKPYRPSSKY